MDIINKKFEVKENSIFNIRKREYSELLDNIKQMLEPVKEIGFTIKDLSIRPSRVVQGELSRTLKENIVIKLSKDIHDIDLSCFIPKLVDDNYIVINGRRKIPLFQLFDLPIITRGETIKLRTNVATLVVENTNEQPYIKIHFLGKLVPLSLLMFCMYDKEEIFKDFQLDLLDEKGVPKDMFSKLRIDLKLYYESSESFGKEDFIHEVGRTYSDYNQMKKGELIIYALNIIPKIDIMSSRFFRTDSIISELVNVIKGDSRKDIIADVSDDDIVNTVKNPDDLINRSSYDDLLFSNKRIRCFEYMILANIAKSIFDLCMANYKSNKTQFNVNSSKILSDSNVSDIIQFDFSINPLDEITKLCRTSLVGPGGFKRENVPNHLRDIYPSMMGRICPVDTPDRDNCGVLQNLLPNVGLDKDLRFTEESLDKQVVSPVVSMVPFLEHDDQTRLQMASSQMRQAIKLDEVDTPLIQSGCESLYADQTRFIYRAKKDGVIVSTERDFTINNFIIVRYDDGEVDIIDIDVKNNYVENFDYLQRVDKIKAGDKFKKGDILASSSFAEDGEIKIGRNLRTAVMTYFGYNYEDGIVISDRLAKSFQSGHYLDLSFILPPNQVLLPLRSKGDYNPLPHCRQVIEYGQVYAIKQKMPIDTLTYERALEEPIELFVKHKVHITRVNIYPNNWNKLLHSFDDWVEGTIYEQQKKQKELIHIIKNTFNKSKAEEIIKEKNLDKFNWIGKYRNKGERIDGILVELGGIYTRELSVGDKIANRHGNKGVISAIFPYKKMPATEDGKHVDLCINPLGIISRMNIGQLFELHLSTSLMDLKKYLNKMLIDKINQNDVKKYLLDYIKIIDNTEDNWYYKQFEEQLPEVIDNDFVKNLSLLQPPFESVTFEQLNRAMEYTNTPYTQKVYNYKTKSWSVNNISVGYLYFFKLIHIAEDRLAARGIGGYTRRTLQPPGGRKLSGGQRLGEMEVNAMIGQGGMKNLYEMLTTKSDCIDLKNKFFKESVETSLISDSEKEIDETPESLHLFNSYLTVIGLKH